MKAILTFDNGQKLAVDIVAPPTWLRKGKPRFWNEFEQDFVSRWNAAQPHAAHKIVRAHIQRN